MPIQVVLEFRAKAGQRAALHAALEALVEKHGATLAGYGGSRRYDALEDADVLVEIATWDSVEARARHLEEAKASGAFAAAFALLDGPPRVTLLREAVRD